MSKVEIPMSLINQADNVIKTDTQYNTQRLFGLANPSYQSAMSARTLRRAGKKIERQARKRGDKSKYSFMTS